MSTPGERMAPPSAVDFTALYHEVAEERHSLKVRLREAEELLRDYLAYMNAPCRLDHDGYCHEHMLQPGEHCTVKRTLSFLEATR